MFSYYRNPERRTPHRRRFRNRGQGWRYRHPKKYGRSRPWRRNSAPVWGGPLYRRNLLPVARRAELIEQSPGNFRPPTMEVTKRYLEDWESSGITEPDDFALYQFEDIAKERLDGEEVSFTSPAIERELERNRMEEALYRRSRFRDKHREAIERWNEDPETYKFPKMSQPVGSKLEDWRDIGDYAEVSEEQAYNYLYQFIHRNAELPKRERDDPHEHPWNWRYKEAVLVVGPRKAENLVRRAFARAGKPVDERYLPGNLYEEDVIGLYPEPEEVAASRYYRRRLRRRRRYNPW